MAWCRIALGADRVAQRGGHVSLAAHVVEALGAPLAAREPGSSREKHDLGPLPRAQPRPLRGAGIAGRPRSQPKSRYRCFLPDLTEFTRFVIERDPAIAAHRKATSTTLPPGSHGSDAVAGVRRRRRAEREPAPPAGARRQGSPAPRAGGLAEPVLEAHRRRCPRRARTARNRSLARSIGAALPFTVARQPRVVEVAHHQPAALAARAPRTSTRSGA